MVLRLRDPYSRVRDGDVDRALRRLSRRPAAPPARSSTPISATGPVPGAGCRRRKALQRAAGPGGAGSRSARGRGSGDRPRPGAAALVRSGRLRGRDRALAQPRPARGGIAVLQYRGHAPLPGRQPAPRPRPPFAGRIGARPSSPACPPGRVWRSRWAGWCGLPTQGPVHWHNGGTAGFGSFIGFDLRRRAGVAALISRRHDDDLDEAALRSHLRASGGGGGTGPGGACPGRDRGRTGTAANPPSRRRSRPRTGGRSGRRPR